MKGFTLVELLIVVIILAILAAIVVPQFASTTDDAKESALDSTLSNMRSAIDLYRQQHGEYPAFITAVPASGCTTGTKGAGLVNTSAAFIEQLSMYTDADGGACSIADTTFKYGPYLKKSSLPANPITLDDTLVVATTGNLVITVQTSKGWAYDVKNGKFVADDDSLDSGGVVKYSEH